MKFSCSSEILFLLFLSFPLDWWCPFPIFPSTCNFPFLRAFWFFLDLVILFLLLFFLNPLFIMSIAYCSIPNFIPISWLYIPIVCIKVFSSFSFFCKQLNVIYIYKGINIFLWFSLLVSFSHLFKLMVFHWRLSDSKPPPVSATLPSILADLNNAVVCMVTTCPLIAKSSCSFTNPLGMVPNTPITIGITVTFMILSVLTSLARSLLLLLLWFKSFSH